MTKLQFAQTARPLPIRLDIQPRITKGGSCGWTARGTLPVTVDGIEYRALVTVQVTIPRSKTWKE